MNLQKGMRNKVSEMNQLHSHTIHMKKENQLTSKEIKLFGVRRVLPDEDSEIE